MTYQHTNREQLVSKLGCVGMCHPVEEYIGYT